jgi:hypothetical protein
MVEMLHLVGPGDPLHSQPCFSAVDTGCVPWRDQHGKACDAKVAIPSEQQKDFGCWRQECFSAKGHYRPFQQGRFRSRETWIQVVPRWLVEWVSLQDRMVLQTPH